MKKAVMTLWILFVAVSGAFAQDQMRAGVGALKQGLGKQVGQERRDAAGGRAWDFEKGSVYWSGKTGAHLVSGTMLKKYKELGAEGGALGYPVADERLTAENMQQTFEHGFITANRAGDTSVEILAGVNITEGGLVVSGTNPPILGIDNDGTLFVRGDGNVEALLRCSCVKKEQKFSTRGSCTAKVDGDTATCIPAPACDSGSCAFEIVDK
ncbi:MAG: hypothetical protein ABI779_20605 [Acidobacteriota bacterium]